MADSISSALLRVADRLIRARYPILIAGLVVTVLAIRPSQRLTFDQSIESLYARDDPHLKDFRESKALFGGDEIVIVAYEEKNLFLENGDFNADTAAEIREFSHKLSAVPGVQAKSTQNLADAFEPPGIDEDLKRLIPGDGFFSRGARLAARKLITGPITQKKTRKLVEGLLIGEDGKTTAILLRLQPKEETSVPRAKTFAKIREIAVEHKPPAYVAGEPIQVHDMFRLVERDGRVLFYVSLALLAAVILFFFRSIQWVVLPLLVVMVTVTWTKALLVLTDARLSMVSAMLNSLVTIVGIATVTHVTVRYRKHRLVPNGRHEALRQTIREIGPPVFWACATTAVGFAALLSSRITPVRSFGLMMSLATTLVLVVVVTLLPGGILIGRLSVDPGHAPGERKLVALLGGMTRVVSRHPKLLVGAFLSVFAVAVAGLSRLTVETDFSKNFRKDSEIVQALDFIETRLGGAGTWEVNFPAKDVELLNDRQSDFYKKIERLAERLRTEVTRDGKPQLTKVIAITDGLNNVPSIPGISDPIEIVDAISPEFVPSLYNAKQGRMRIMLRAYERQSAEEKDQLVAQVERIAREVFPDDPKTDEEDGAKATGLFVLLKFLIESLLHDQWKSFVLAAIGIGTMMTVAFRSLRIGAISVLPNLFPIVLLIGTIGWIGLPINIATAMIASVSMGLTVDSSIHYISSYRRFRRGGASIAEAIRATHEEVGNALVFANVALVIGFSVLSLSNFIPLVYFGLLVSVAIFGGLIGNLLLLPVLLQWVDNDADVVEAQ
jgi:predicted RND superfamily exporter protein